MIQFKTRFEAIETLIVETATFKTWVGSTDDATLRSRVTWPIRAANLNSYPYVNLSPGSARIGSLTGGFESSANFVDSGSLFFRLWANDTSPNDPQAGFDTFEQNVSDLIGDLIEDGQNGPVILTEYVGDPPCIVHSKDNAFLLGETSDDDTGFWHFSAEIKMGVR